MATIDVDKQISVIKGSLCSKENWKTLSNFLGNNEEKKMKFLSCIIEDIKNNPKLIECSITSLIISYFKMAQLGFMPSSISGESYVLPYNTKQKGMVAEFQIGYKGYITMLYKGGVNSVKTELVRENDVIEIVNGKVTHKVNPRMSEEQRGELIGCYLIAEINNFEYHKYMNSSEILKYRDFSKSYINDIKYGKVDSLWNEDNPNDPQKWIWRKTVIKQAAKELPINESIKEQFMLAERYDNKESIVSDIVGSANDVPLSSRANKLKNTIKNDIKGKTESRKANEEVVNTENIDDMNIDYNPDGDINY